MEGRGAETAGGKDVQAAWRFFFFYPPHGRLEQWNDVPRNGQRELGEFFFPHFIFYAKVLFIWESLALVFLLHILFFKKANSQCEGFDRARNSRGVCVRGSVCVNECEGVCV